MAYFNPYHLWPEGLAEAGPPDARVWRRLRREVMAEFDLRGPTLEIGGHRWDRSGLLAALPEAQEAEAWAWHRRIWLATGWRDFLERGSPAAWARADAALMAVPGFADWVAPYLIPVYDHQLGAALFRADEATLADLLLAGPPLPLAWESQAYARAYRHLVQAIEDLKAHHQRIYHEETTAQEAWAGLPPTGMIRSVALLPAYFARRQRQWFQQVKWLAEGWEARFAATGRSYPGVPVLRQVAPDLFPPPITLNFPSLKHPDPEPAWQGILKALLPAVFFLWLGWYIGSLPSVRPTYPYRFTPTPLPPVNWDSLRVVMPPEPAFFSQDSLPDTTEREAK